MTRLMTDALGDIEAARLRLLIQERELPLIESVGGDHQARGMDVVAMMENAGDLRVTIQARTKFGQPTIAEWKGVAIERDDVRRANGAPGEFKRGSMADIEVAADQV